MSFYKLPIKAPIDSLLLVIIIIYSIFHLLRIHFKDKPKPSSKRKKWINLKTVSFLAILSAMANRSITLLVYVPAYYFFHNSSANFLNNDTCKYLVIVHVELGAVQKLGRDLFVLLRSKVTEIDSKRSVWHYIGVIMVMTDALFMLYIISGIPKIASIYDKDENCMPLIDKSVYIWFGLSDLVIGVYFLIIFIYPLRKYVEMESDHDQTTFNQSDDSLSKIAKRIMKFSSIMIITTLIATIIVVIYSPLASLVYGIDMTINVICIVMQFGSIDSSKIPPKYLWFMRCAQCECELLSPCKRSNQKVTTELQNVNSSTVSKKADPQRKNETLTIELQTGTVAAIIE